MASESEPMSRRQVTFSSSEGTGRRADRQKLVSWLIDNGNRSK